MSELVAKGIAGFGALLFLIGLWAVWRLLRARPASPETTDKPSIESSPGPFPDHSPNPSSESSPDGAVHAGPAAVPAASDRSDRATPDGSDRATPDGSDRERLVCLVSRYDKVIQSPIAGVYINLGKCFADLGFQVHRASTLAELEDSLKTGVPGVLAVDCRLGPRTLREVARLARQHPGMRQSVFLFYNAERPEALTPPAVLPHAHFLGLAFASQQVMEILAPAFEFEAQPSPDGGEKDTGAIFEGVLSENSLPEILQFLEIGKRTGLLSLEAEQPAGVINFMDGDITSAQTHLNEGVEAVFEMLGLNRGKFRFFPGRVTGTVHTRLAPTQVLMHWAQRVDETGEMVAREEGKSLLDTFT